MKVEILIDSFLDAGEKPTISTNFVRKLISNINLKLRLLFEKLHLARIISPDIQLLTKEKINFKISEMLNTLSI